MHALHAKGRWHSQQDRISLGYYTLHTVDWSIGSGLAGLGCNELKPQVLGQSLFFRSLPEGLKFVSVRQSSRIFALQAIAVTLTVKKMLRLKRIMTMTSKTEA